MMHSTQNSGQSFNCIKKEKNTIDKIREFQLDYIVIDNEYDIIKEIGSGDYGKVLLAVHKNTNTQVALKAVPRATTPLKDFFLEFHYSYFLSPHHVILDTYDVAFETNDFYCFAQEVAPLGDVWQAVERTEGAGLFERDAKVIIEQLIKAIEFMHEKNLVHRDIRAENVLVFAPNFTKIKLTDFGLTRKAGTLVKKRTRSLPTCPPEIWETLHLEGYHVELGSDVWQLAMFIFIITQARFPWEKADITDLKFVEFIDWQKRKTTKLPREFTRFTPRILRLFRRLLEVKPNKRYPITEVNKYLKDPWIKTKMNRHSTMHLPSRQNHTQMLEVPSLSMKLKRESIENAMYTTTRLPSVSRSLSCSQLQFNPNFVQIQNQYNNQNNQTLNNQYNNQFTQIKSNQYSPISQINPNYQYNSINQMNQINPVYQNVSFSYIQTEQNDQDPYVKQRNYLLPS